MTFAGIAVVALLTIKCTQEREAPENKVLANSFNYSRAASYTPVPGPDANCNQASAVPAKDALGLEKIMALMSTRDDDSYLKVKQALTGMGGRITVEAAPEIILALLPPGKEAGLKNLREILAVSAQSLDETLPGLSRRQRKMASIWNRRLSGMIEPTRLKNPPPPPNDLRQRPSPKKPVKIKPPKELPRGFSLPAAADFRRKINRSFEEISPAPTVQMSGTVAVAVFFPESNGGVDPNLDTWTTDQVNNVMVELAAGLDWWATIAPVAQNLSFVLSSYDPSSSSCAQTSYEPITRSSDEIGLWIGQIMDCLGYESGDYLQQVDTFNGWLQADTGAVAAFSVFVANDAADPDHEFSDGYFAFSYRGGPLEVMTYGNDGYGIGNMDAVFAHETGHIFWAYDEYSSAWSCFCAYGSENCQNQNCEKSCLKNESCIMRGQVAPYTNDKLCDCTRGQIGWSCGSCASLRQSCPCVAAPYCCFHDSYTIASGDSVSLALTTSDQKDASGKYFDDFEFCGGEGDQVTIDMLSGSFDAALELFPPSSCAAAAASDDNGGYGNNARIVFTLTETGTWTIKAGAAVAGATGSYRLWLNGPAGCLNDAACVDANACTLIETCAHPGGYPYSTCAFSPAPAGTDCGVCKVCNAAGGCAAKPADDSACGTIDCSGLNSTCRTYSDLTSARCKELGVCKAPNSSDCGLYSNANSATACEDGEECTADDHCDGSGDCLGTDLPDGTACGTGGFCSSGECKNCVLAVLRPDGGETLRAGGVLQDQVDRDRTRLQRLGPA